MSIFVKICGTTTEQDALLAVAMGADAVGFIFAPSPRQVTAERVADIVKHLAPEVLTVGVFRNDPVDRILDIVAKTGVRAVQLHGTERPAVVQALRKQFPIAIIKVFPAGHPEIQKAKEYQADIVMIDAPSPGSGQVFDWRLADGVPDGVRLLLAGGLTPDNVAEAIECVRPWGVDVASGVESEPGKKDPRKVRTFIKRAKQAAPIAYEGSGEGPYDWQDKEFL